MLNKTLLKDSLGWGLLLWLFGYILGFVFFFFVQASLIGWFVTPFGIVATLYVLLKKVQSSDLKYYLILSVVWTLIAAVMDYIFMVKLLNPADGYYKADIYFYYASTFLMPLLAWGWKRRK